MKILAAAAIASLAVLAAPGAEAGERNTVVVGPAGVTTGSTVRVCHEGACTYEHEVTGPYGYSVDRAATTTEVAPGVYHRDATAEGPRGATATRSSTLTVER